MDFTPIRRCKLFATLKRIGAISLPTPSLVIWVCFDSSQPLHYAFFIMAKDPRYVGHIPENVEPHMAR
jgi:hypothetical protein